MAFQVILCVVSCVLQLNIIQANEVPILSVKDVQSTKTSYVTFLLKHQTNAAISWFPHGNQSNVQTTTKDAVSAEYTPEASPFPVDFVGVRSGERLAFLPQKGFYFETKPGQRDLGSFSLINASPPHAMLRQGEEFEMALVVERQTASKASIEEGIHVNGFRNWENFASRFLLEVGSDVKKMFNDRVRCNFAVNKKPGDTVRVEAKCFITGVPVGTTDNYAIVISVYGGNFNVVTEIEGEV
ncbi:hypothetical protein CAPTEDRAFT_212846 [Capitella teleta]|uniref:Uncharacterized protein n=1 Tax=Capitella teleta TaxID=283909 RepID=R7UY94_CAPTE|nr:hypothetical protein CAPTEDRAFT_212846 [Capitella teleta]|eukprot:ELU11222.1 hypothetical protein CAPTEDRAFT_212846 [Capitella teleta]